MKKTLLIILTLALSLSLLQGCTQRGGTNVAHSGGEKLSVVATIFPAYDFTRQIAGDKVSLTMLLPPGTEIHSFDPSPQDIITIQNADIFIYTGGESDTWADSILDTLDTSDMTILSMMDMVETLTEAHIEGMQHDHEHEEGEDAEEHESEYDEHVWTSPVNAMVISRTISQELAALDAENAQTYADNCAAYIEKLQALDASFRNTVQTGARRTLIFADRFPFRYLAEEYGLDYFAAFPGCSAETEASAKTVTFLIEKVRSGDIPAVFYIEFSNQKLADTICEETGASKLLLHSCHNVTRSEFQNGVTYVELMTQNMLNLKTALA